MKKANLTASHDDFSDIELDFFKRGDDLHPPAEDPAPTADRKPDSDAN